MTYESGKLDVLIANLYIRYNDVRRRVTLWCVALKIGVPHDTTKDDDEIIGKNMTLQLGHLFMPSLHSSLRCIDVCLC